MRRNCVQKHCTEARIGGEIEVTGRRIRTGKELIDDLKEVREY